MGVVRRNNPLRGRSERLRSFVQEMPLERRSIFEFVVGAADEIEPGGRVADLGAGSAPYRELFDHAEYVAIDWAASAHEAGPDGIDVVAPADAVPLEDGSFDAVVCTQVLEHVPDPSRVLAEVKRLLKPRGRLYLTAPLAWQEHEMPHDYFRYTSSGLRHLLVEAGFEDVELHPRTDSFTALAQLVANARWEMGRAPDGLDAEREQAERELDRMAERLESMRALDTRGGTLTLGYAARAVAPPPPLR